MNRYESNVPWYEYLSWRGTEVEHVTKPVWPEGNPPMNKALQEYWQKVEALGVLFLESLAQHLKLEPTTFSQPLKNPENRFAGCFHDWTNRTGWRLNHYPACPRPDQTLGLGPHADPNALTLLLQDDVGGLQVRKGNHWIDVTSVPGSLIINIGDCLEAWSNGRYRSVVHRVLTNEKVSRLSAGFYLTASKCQRIEAPPELVDDEHPSLFRPFTYGKYLPVIFERRLMGKSSLDVVRN